MPQEVNKLVSIIVPAYNHERYIKDAIESILNQTYEKMEIIIINDGSEDNTGKICRKFADRDSRIQYFEQPNVGAHHAINQGILRSSGAYLAILNSDDVFYPYKIKRCLQIVEENPSLQLISGKVELIGSDGKVLKKGVEVDWQKRAFDYFRTTGLFPLSILNENFVATTSNIFFTRQLWEKNGGFQPLRYCHDLDFLMAAFRNTPYFFDRETTHIQYRVHPGNTIKENLQRIRVEIAAVIAAYLVSDNMNLLSKPNSKTIHYFKEFLDNKNLSNLLILLMMDYINTEDRNSFYKKLSSEGLYDLYKDLLL